MPQDRHHPDPSTFRSLMSIHINPATNPFGRDINGPLTTSQNDRHDAGNLDALFHLSLQRHSSPGTSQRHHQGRNTSEERDPRVASSWATQPNDRDASR